MTNDLAVELRYGLPEFTTFVPRGWERIVLDRPRVDESIGMLRARLDPNDARQRALAEAAAGMPEVIREHRIFGALRAKAGAESPLRPYWFTLAAWRGSMERTIGEQIRERVLPGPHVLLDELGTVLSWYAPADAAVPGLRTISYLLPSPKSPDRHALELTAWVSTAQMPDGAGNGEYASLVDFTNRIALSHLWSEGAHVRMTPELLAQGRVTSSSPEPFAHLR